MATKITDFFYDISPTEGLTFTITGPADPRVSLDGTTVLATKGAPFRISPQMLNGLGSTHSLNSLLLFPAGNDTYTVAVDSDAGANLSTFPVTGPNQGNFTKLQITIEVV